jgi:hypothetical protein
MEQTMEIDELPENDERLLRKPEIKRDEQGRFEQHGTGLIKKAQKSKKIPILNSNPNPAAFQPGHKKPGPGRPKGSRNKTTLQLKEAVLAALEKLGGDDYLVRLGIENSSAFAGLLGKVLPTTLQASESGGGDNKIVFERIIVMPDGQRYVEGKTPKQIAPPASHALPNSAPANYDPSEINDLED